MDEGDDGSHDQVGQRGATEPGSHAPIPGKLTADQWATQFQQRNGREPTMAEYQTAVARQEIAKDRDPSFQQMTDGFRQIAGGAKGLYESRVAPAVERSRAKEFFAEKVAPATRNAAERVRSDAAAPHSQLALWSGRALVVTPCAAFVAIIALFLPIASMGGYSINFFDDETRGEGIALLVLFLVTIASNVWLLAVRTKLARVIAGVAATVAGVFGVLDGFGNMINYASESGASVGFGVILLGLSGLAVLAGGVLALFGLRAQAGNG